MYCPKCGRVMQEIDGRLVCVHGEMPLSRAMERVLRAEFPQQAPRPETAEVGYEVTRWFCPGCGVPLSSCECPRCGKRLHPVFPLVEYHPHRTEDGHWY